MTTEALKAAALTALDAATTPYIVAPPTAGEGAKARLNHVDGYQTVSASMAAGSTYALARIPSTALVKRVTFASEAQGAGKFNVGLSYSTSTHDGTKAANQGAVIDADFFATDIDCASAVAEKDITNESGTYSPDKRGQPIWKAAGLTSDPGGMFDIVATVHTTDVTTGTGKLYLAAEYVE